MRHRLTKAARILVILALAVPILSAQSRPVADLSGDVIHLQEPERPAVLVGKGSISGTVVNSRTHEPVRKAHVLLNGLTQLSAVTDSSGSFVFRSLAPGSYWLTANHEDYFGNEALGRNSHQVELADGQELGGIELSLQPGAIISGHVLDDEGNPLQNCMVTAMRFDTQGRGGARLSPANGSSTDAEGSYRLHAIPQGRYALRVQCNETFPAPHGFMRRGDPMTPVEGYASETRGGADKGSAMLIPAGAELTGVDFQLRRSPMFAVRGRISGPEGFFGRGAQLSLVPRDDSGDSSPLQSHMEPRHGIFRFLHVPPGSYDLVASVNVNDRMWQGRQSVEVGKIPVTEVTLQLNPAPSVTGSIRSDDSGLNVAGQISLMPLSPNYRGPFPTATVNPDGTFTFKSVLPGHFKFAGVGMGSYVKSFTAGGQEISPDDFEIGDGAMAPLEITMSAKVGKVEVAIDGSPAVGTTISGLLIPSGGGDPQVSNAVVQSGNATLQFGSVPPGKYRAYVVETLNARLAASSPALLKNFESRSVAVEVPESGNVRVTAPLVSSDDLQKVAETTE